jgi:hypothetical protein
MLPSARPALAATATATAPAAATATAIRAVMAIAATGLAARPRRFSGIRYRALASGDAVHWPAFGPVMDACDSIRFEMDYNNYATVNSATSSAVLPTQMVMTAYTDGVPNVLTYTLSNITINNGIQNTVFAVKTPNGEQ